MKLLSVVLVFSALVMACAAPQQAPGFIIKDGVLDCNLKDNKACRECSNDGLFCCFDECEVLPEKPIVASDPPEEEY